MPTRPPRACPHCPESMPCPVHTRAKERYRGSRQSRGYGAAHEQWARLVLKLDPICRYCGRAPSRAADHIVPWKQGGAKYDTANGAGACYPCHNRKTAIENAGGTPPTPLPRRELA